MPSWITLGLQLHTQRRALLSLGLPLLLGQGLATGTVARATFKQLDMAALTLNVIDLILIMDLINVQLYRNGALESITLGTSRHAYLHWDTLLRAYSCMLAGGVLALGNMHHCHYFYLLYLQTCTLVLWSPWILQRRTACMRIGTSM